MEVKVNVGNLRFLPHNMIYGGKCWSVAVYVRLSDEDRNKKRKTDLSQSIQNQIEYLKNYVEMLNENIEESKNRLEIYRIYSDDDCTGMNFDRGGFREMLLDIKRNLVDCIMVKSLSRLGRNDREMQQYLKEEFEQCGSEVRVCAVGDGYDSLYKDPMDMELRFKLMMNEQYSQTQHTNVMIGMHTMQKKGKYVGAFAPYGYIKDPEDKHHLIADDMASVVVKRIYGEYIGGLSPKKIARRLTEDGIVNPSTYKRMSGSNFVCGNKVSDEETYWTGAAVKRILMDEVYIGTVVQHKRVKNKLLDKRPSVVPKQDRISVSHMHEPIISEMDWKLAQEMMKNIKRDATKEDEFTIFKGLLKCGDCGHAMRKKWESYQTKKGERNRYLYYNCATFRDYGNRRGKVGNAPGCSSHTISDKIIRSIVLDDINRIIGQWTGWRDMVNRQEREGTSKMDIWNRLLREKRNELNRIRERLKRARNKWLDEEMTKEEYEETRMDNRNRKEALLAEMEELEKRISTEETQQRSPWVQELLCLGKLKELDRLTVVKLIDHIEVYEGKTIKIIYKFSDEIDFLFEKSWR